MVDAEKAERRIVTVERVIEAAPTRIFDVLTDIRRHTELDGSGMLQGEPRGPERLELGSRFTMGMRQARASYRSVNRVVEFEPDARIAWETVGQWRGRRLFGGQRWRYELSPADDGTLVRHSYVWGYAVAPLPPLLALFRYPQRMASSMPRTLEKLDEAVTADPADA